MLTLQRCREIVGADCVRSDADLERIRDHLRALAEVAVEAFPLNPHTAPPRDPPPDRKLRDPDEFGAALQLVAEDERYAVTERAAIMEHDGGLDRAHAERRAILRVVDAARKKPRQP